MTLPSPVPFGRFFLPGPTAVRPEIMQAMQQPIIPHRGPAMAEIFRQMQPSLRRVFRTEQPVMLATCSGTGLMEAAIRGGVRRRVLVAIGGTFGERFADIAEACDKEVVRLMVPPGHTVEADHLARFLDSPPVDAVALVHSESSTGALAPLEELARVVERRPDLVLLVDAVSSLGGVPIETDAWGLDFVFTASQKALALPPGLALAAASPRFLDRARQVEDRGWYLDPVRLAEAAIAGQPTHTPAIPQIYALARQLRDIDAEGMEARWQRHREMALVVEQWLVGRPELALLASEGRRSWTVSAIRLPPGIDPREVVTGLADRGWVVAAGIGELAGSVLRIGHMGDHQVEELEGLLGAIEEEIDRVRSAAL